MAFLRTGARVLAALVATGQQCCVTGTLVTLQRFCSAPRQGPGPGKAAGTVPVAIYYQMPHSTGISNRCSHLNRPNYLPLLSLKYISKLQLCLPSQFPSVLMPQSAPGMPQMNEFQVSHRLMCHQPELLDTLRKNDSNQERRSGRHPKVTD